MKSFPVTNSLLASVRVYRALLVLYPEKFREHYETQLVQVFRDSFRYEYDRNGISGVIDLWLHTIADLLVTVLLEHLVERSQYMFAPRFIFWGGLVSSLGGILWLTVIGERGDITFSLALLLTLAGLTALYARQGKQAGAIGSSGFVLGLLGTVLVLSLLVWDMISGNSLDPDNTSSSTLQFAQLALGMSILGIGDILLGLRTLQTKVLIRSTAMLPIVLGVLHIGFGFSIWLAYDLSSKGIELWNPLSATVIALLSLSWAIGILWAVLGAILAGDAFGQLSKHPTVSA